MMILSLILGTPEIILIIFAAIAFLLIIPFAIIDVYKSKFLTPGTKLLWLIVILIAPYAGAMIYLLWGRKQKTML